MRKKVEGDFLNYIELDGRSLIIFDGRIGQRKTKILAQGVLFYNGDYAELENEITGTRFKLPEEYEKLIELPVTGHWKNKYPGIDYYVEVS